jgi:aminomethyltransferase
MDLKRTPLYQTHLALGARMVEFGGWDMPVQYSGILEEHRAVRDSAGLFDIDHMGQFEVKGPDALPFLQGLVSSDIAPLQLNTAQYGLVCYEDGGIVDDIFVYRFDNWWMVVVNAGNREKDFAWMEAHIGGLNVSFHDISDDLYMLALQGPKAEEVLQKVEGSDLSTLKYHHAIQVHMDGEEGILARTGYTGEDGFELFLPVRFGKHVWDAILDAGKSEGVLPIGLGARDSLRFEAKFPLYGHEIDANTSPLEAALGWACSLKKEFKGRDSILKQKLEGVKKKLVGFEMVERGIARKDYPITKDGKSVGYVTTGMFAPTLEKNVGLGFVPPDLAKVGTDFEVIIRNKPTKARVVKTPFYPNRARGR